MKISIITVVFNNEATIGYAVESVNRQQYGDVEHIIIDGGSKDGTLGVIKANPGRAGIIVSEKDKGMYDALNKGISLASGDIIGILHSDDVFNDDLVLSRVAAAFNTDNSLDATVGDIVFVSPTDNDKVVRYYSAANWRLDKFAYGIMPPHPSFFCKRSVYQKLGLYQTDYRITADYELMVRYLLIHKIKFQYLPIITTKMRPGGISTKNLKSNLLLNKEIRRSCLDNGVYTNYLMIYSKYFSRFREILFLRGRFGRRNAHPETD